MQMVTLTCVFPVFFMHPTVLKIWPVWCLVFRPAVSEKKNCHGRINEYKILHSRFRFYGDVQNCRLQWLLEHWGRAFEFRSALRCRPRFSLKDCRVQVIEWITHPRSTTTCVMESPFLDYCVSGQARGSLTH
jgi:hypothetical protein